MRGFKIFSGNANLEFSKKLAKQLNVVISNATISRFSDGEINVQISESVRGKDVYIVQPICPPTNDNLMELLIMVDAFRRSSALDINAVIPYFGYARQDRKAAPRVPISAKLVANLLQVAGVSRVVTLDLHAGQIQGFFDIPVDNLYGSIVFYDYIRSKGLKNPVIASPDIGGVSRARYFASNLGYDLVIIDKKREKANESDVMNIIGEVENKSVILVDDIIDTAGTMTKAAQALKDHGALEVLAVGTHAIFSSNALERIERSALSEVVVSDSVPMNPNPHPKVKVLSVAPLFAEVIRRIFHHESVNSLFP